MPEPEEILSELEVFGIRLGLDRVEALLSSLSAPQRSLRVVLVAGTNGKGSTSALLASILGAAGLKVGLYTSPHLESVEERLRIGGRSISRDELGTLLETVVESGRRLAGEPPTYFEALTAAALLWFQQRSVDVAVLEVGLGGRLDATNVTTPVLSLITSIGLDHQKVLGNTLAEIAVEKAGILRPGRKALIWVDSFEARRAIFARAGQIGAFLTDAREDVLWGPIRQSDGLRTLETPSGTYTLTSPLAGAYQFDNIALAVVGAESLARSLGFAVGRAAVEAGIRGCRWPGRLESVAAGNFLWLLDGAHNVAAMLALQKELGRRPNPNRLMVFGALADKSVAEMSRIAAASASSLLLVRPKSGRAATVEQLAEALPEVPWGVAETVDAGLDRILESDFDEIVVCGSLYLVGEVRCELSRRFGTPSPAAEMSTGP